MRRGRSNPAAGAVVRATVAFAILWPAASPAEEGAEIRAFVQENYRARADLNAWGNTARLLTSFVKQRFPSSPDPVVKVDGARQDFVGLLTGTGAGKIPRILYLAAHVDASGRILFADGSKDFPSSIAKGAAETGQLWKPDLVVVDSCHAATFAYDRDWITLLSCDHLFASDTNQLAWEMDFARRFPIHLAKKYPGAQASALQLLGAGWDGTLSDLGFRASKLIAAGNPDPFSDPISFFRNLSSVPREELRSKQFRQANLIWYAVP